MGTPTSDDLGAPSTFTHERSAAIALAREAGALCLTLRARGDLRVEHKANDEPVSAADRHASTFIVSSLRRTFADDVIVSEEEPIHTQKSARRTWFVDPIDGTKAFIRGDNDFAVMIGLCVDGVPTVGAVYQPVGDRLLVAVPGSAYLCTNGNQRLLSVSSRTEPLGLRMVSTRRLHQDIPNEPNALALRYDRPISAIGLKLALIALGEFDVYVNPTPRCKAWDTCAPEAIIRAAGGTVTDVHAKPLCYVSTDVTRTRGVVASNTALHNTVLQRLSALIHPASTP